ncbi:hypothetical protein, partial [Niveispirillum fermenti]|uniref:hypothetical protein n=1 Tax=Niveispirillum fermenti TaxID=1233113 RepID=UPI003A8BA39C
TQFKGLSLMDYYAQMRNADPGSGIGRNIELTNDQSSMGNALANPHRQRQKIRGEVQYDTSGSGL